jgi:HEAT repeat protein
LSDSDEVLRELLKGIEQLGKRQAVPLLRRTLKSRDRNLREFACITLGNLGGKRALGLLIHTLNFDASVCVRERAAHVLSFLFLRKDDDIPYRALYDILVNSQEHPAIRAQAAEGIGNILGWTDRRLKRFREAERILLTCLHDESPDVRFWSIFSLGEMRSRKALPELRQIAATDHVKCRNMWLVSDEASDVIAVFEGRDRPARKPAWDGECKEYD